MVFKGHIPVPSFQGNFYFYSVGNKICTRIKILLLLSFPKLNYVTNQKYMLKTGNVAY
jgi:hypothetical protein